MRSAYALSALSLLGVTWAQSSVSNHNKSYLDITFSAAGARNCGRGTPGDGHAVTLHITSPPIAQTCIDLNTTFSQGGNITDGYTTGSYSCVGHTACGVNYTLTGANNYSSNVNYSQIFYTQQNSSAPNGGVNRPGKLFFQTYDGPGCLQAMHADGELRPWVEWNCNKPGGQCSNIEYGIKSFAIGPTKQRDQDGRCLVAAEYAASGARGGKASSSYAALVLAIFCGLVLGT